MSLSFSYKNVTFESVNHYPSSLTTKVDLPYPRTHNVNVGSFCAIKSFWILKMTNNAFLAISLEDYRVNNVQSQEETGSIVGSVDNSRHSDEPVDPVRGVVK